MNRFGVRFTLVSGFFLFIASAYRVVSEGDFHQQKYFKINMHTYHISFGDLHKHIPYATHMA